MRDPIVYIYMRTSTTMQDVEHGSQWSDIERYLEYKNLTYKEENVIREQLSGSVDWKKRKLYNLITNRCVPGDILVVSETSRISRNSTDLVQIIDFLKKNEIIFHACKENLTIAKDDMTSNILIHVYAMIAQTEKQFTQARVKAALETKRRKGIKMGAPYRSELEEKREHIEKRVNDGWTTSEIAQELNVKYLHVYKFCMSRGMITKKPDRLKAYQVRSRDEQELEIMPDTLPDPLFDPYLSEINEMLYRKKPLSEISGKYGWNHRSFILYRHRRLKEMKKANEDDIKEELDIQKKDISVTNDVSPKDDIISTSINDDKSDKITSDLQEKLNLDCKSDRDLEWERLKQEQLEYN